MHGYTAHYHNTDTTTPATSPAWSAGPRGVSFIDDRMMAAWPVTIIPYSSTPSYMRSAPQGKREQTLITSTTKVPFQNRKRYKGYCTGVFDPDFQSAGSLDSALLPLNVTKVFGSCVNFKVSVVVPKLEFFMLDRDPQFDTLLTQTYVLNCHRTFNALEAQATSLSTMPVPDEHDKHNKPSVLSGGISTAPPSPLPYQLLTLDLTSIRSDLLSEDWFIEVAVTTPGGEVEVVNEGEDWQPQLVLKGGFNRTDPLADYTLHNEYADQHNVATLGATMWAKVDDSLHTSNTSIGPLPDHIDNSRRMKMETYFGMDYRSLRATETKTKLGVTWKDEIVMSYTGLGQSTKVTDELNDTVSTVYDGSGRPVRVNNGDGTYKTFTYDFMAPSGSGDQNFYGLMFITEAVDEKGEIFEQYYDTFDRLRSEVVSAGSLYLETKYEYDTLNRLVTVVNPAGDTTRYWYDTFGRIKYKYQPDLGYISYAYDDMGNVRFTQTQTQHDEGKLTFTEYDDLGRLTLVGEARIDNSISIGLTAGTTTHEKREKTLSFPAHPTLNLNRYTDQFDANILHDDSVSAILTANKTIWQNPVDSLPLFWAWPTLTETSCGPDPADPHGPSGTLLRHAAQSYTDVTLPLADANAFENIAMYPQNARTVVHYDELPTAGGSVWRYFPSRTRWDSLAPRGVVRNLKGRESAVAYRTHAGEPYHFAVTSYDERGRVEALLHYTENLGFDAVYYTYNSMNLVTSVRVADPKRQHTTWYGYNSNGKVDSVWTQLSDDGYGLGISNPRYPTPQSRPKDPDMAYEYTARWQVDSLFYPPISTRIGYSYNSRRFLDSMVAQKSGSALFRQVLSYDDDGQIIEQKYEHGTSGEEHQEYVYDGAKRLFSFWYDYGATGVVYNYDSVGNRWMAERSVDANVLWSDTYTYADATGPNRLSRLIRLHPNTTRDTTRYSYNGSGALVSQVQSGLSESFAYDNMQGVVKKYSRYSGSGMFGTLQEWSYRYSASGEREQKRAVTVSGDVAKEWTYYLLGLGKQQLAVYEGLETTKSVCGVTDPYVYLWATEYLSYGLGDVHAITTKPTGTTTSEKAYKIEDHLGSTRVVINGSGVVVNTTDYEPFGGIASQSGTLPRKSYIDKEVDSESGLGDFGVRKQDSSIGRFLSVDADWEKYRDLSPYNYAENNPVVLKDPSGYGPGDMGPNKKMLPAGYDGGGGGASDIGKDGSEYKTSAPSQTKAGGESGGGKTTAGKSSSGSSGGTAGVSPESVDPERYPMQQQKGYASSKMEQQTAGRDVRHQNGSVAEARVFDKLIKVQGHIKIQEPGKVTEPGPDFVTYNPQTGNIEVADVKYRSDGGRAPRTISNETLNRWKPAVQEAINNMPNGAERTAAQQAYDAGHIIGNIYKYP